MHVLFALIRPTEAREPIHFARVPHEIVASYKLHAINGRDVQDKNTTDAVADQIMDLFGRFGIDEGTRDLEKYRVPVPERKEDDQVIFLVWSK